MIQSNQETQSKIKRGLDRLIETVDNQSIEVLLPALTFITKLIESYVNSEKNQIKTRYYQMVLVKLIQEFQKRLSEHESEEFTKLTKNKKKIVSDILQYLQKHKNSNAEYNLLQKQEDNNEKNEVNQVIKEIYRFYDEHNLDRAYQMINKLNHIKMTPMKSILMEQHQKKIKKIQKEYHKMISFYSQLTTYGWIFDLEKDNIKMYYEVFQEQKTIAVKMQTELEIEMLPFLAILSEIQLHKTYVPFTYVSDVVKVLGRNKKAAYSKVYVPLLTDRECYYVAVGYDRMDTTGTIFIFTESYDQDEQMQRQQGIPVPPADQSEYVRLKVDYFCFDYQPIARNKAKVVLVTKANFRLTFLPLFILQKSARIFTFGYFQKILEKARNYKGSAFQEKVKANPSLYEFFQSKVDQKWKNTSQ